MEFASVYHKTSEQMSYALDENQLVVNIKTGYDVKKIFIHYGDPFDAGILGRDCIQKTSVPPNLVDNNTFACV